MKIKLTAKFLAELKSGREVSDAVGLILGKPLKGSKLNLGYNHLLKVLMETVGVGENGFLAEFNRTGDLGETVRRLLEKGGMSLQQPIAVLGSLTISQVAEAFREIAEISGRKAMARKDRVLESYLRRLSPLEAKYFVKNLVGEMRHGFSEGLMEEALALAFQANLETVRAAHMALGNLGRVGELLTGQGFKFTKRKLKLKFSVEGLLRSLGLFLRSLGWPWNLKVKAL